MKCDHPTRLLVKSDAIVLVKSFSSSSFTDEELRIVSVSHLKLNKGCQGEFVEFKIFFSCYAWHLFVLKLETIHVFVEKKRLNEPVSILLDEKYDQIQNEAIQAGILLKKTDEKIEQIIDENRKIQAHTDDVKTNAVRFYRNLVQSERMCRFYLLIIGLFLFFGLIIVFTGYLTTK